MVPIYLNGKGKKGYTFDEFEKEFENICESHRKQRRALGFAFILCNFDSAEVIKVLNDKDYWRALNHISGRFLTVFSFHSRQSYEESNRFVEARFGPQFDEAKPSILFFQISEGKVSDSFSVNFTCDTVEGAFQEIRAVLTDAVESVENVLPEYSGNTAEVFNLIKQRLEQRKALLMIKRGFGMVGSIRDVISKIVSLGSP
ncbi:MAG TPA: hypothetical protein VFB72_18885 [Verrucomicrobiae bacterium]|nr:hypothetical protein [Verrucomicrobiae bacterium]